MAGQDELPLPDFGELPITALQHRVRSLQRDDVVTPADTPKGSPVPPDSAAKPPGPLRHGKAGPTLDSDRP